MSTTAQWRGLRVLMLAPVGGYGGFNTSRHRLEALESLGCDVTVVDSALDRVALAGRRWASVSSRLFRHGLPVAAADPAGDRTRLLAAAAAGPVDLVWLEKALTIGARAVAALRALQPGAAIVGFSPDDMQARHNQSRQFLAALPCYDAFLSTKSDNVAELGALGARRVLCVPNGYDPAAFRPMPLDEDARERLGGDIGFIGTHEADRAAQMLELARRGLEVRVWGNGWQGLAGVHPRLRIEGRPLYGDDYARACAAFAINLGFLRKLNRDRQTTRSVEVPACGGFLLAERTEEHRALFVEGEEAEFFADVDELEDKCRRYLAEPAARARVAAAGRRRCLDGGYSNAARISQALASLARDGVLHAPGQCA
jgi:spore maturation protein CgeB